MVHIRRSDTHTRGLNISKRHRVDGKTQRNDRCSHCHKVRDGLIKREFILRNKNELKPSSTLVFLFYKCNPLTAYTHYLTIRIYC